ncbi:MAG: type II toxin-antitoxin system PemK/MazF family toxin [Gammaproteobacteria bacterium]|nr:type II toxin-antitoxin system PemK/MazF family toxin [Gammaproteobacteria bacterium]
MRRGDIWMVDFSTPKGSEAAFRRPAVVASNNSANRSASDSAHGVVTVVPVTSNLRRVYPFQVRLRARDCGLPRDSKAQAEQIRAGAGERLDSRIGRVPNNTMAAIDAALRLHLNL